MGRCSPAETLSDVLGAETNGKRRCPAKHERERNGVVGWTYWHARLEAILKILLSRSGIQSAALCVQSFDWSFEWYATRGCAHPESKVEMRAETLYFVSSITKKVHLCSHNARALKEDRFSLPSSHPTLDCGPLQDGRLTGKRGFWSIICLTS